MTRRKAPPLIDAQLAALVADRRLLLRQLGEVMARKGPSTPNRHAVNVERAERRRALRQAIRRNEHLTAVRCSELLPRPPEPDDA
ncbi:MAG TPA: hypothetical protein VNR64_21645 [Vicinamibacterales bacterium]|nr:hypothetical protein [Vicinamibacterales bacterium]